MKKNSFTLVEMMAVVIVLAIILLVSLPALSSTLKNKEAKEYENYLESLYMAAENYVNFNRIDELKYEKGTKFINVAELINNGYVDANKIDPKTNEFVNPSSTIKITNNDGLYDYKFYDENITLDAYNRDNVIFNYDGYLQHDNTKLIDASVNQNNGVLFGVLLTNNRMVFDGVDDYGVVNNVDYKSSKSFTLEFVGTIDEDETSLLFESSVNSNNNSGSFYINTNEYGTDDITFAMKYIELMNHKMSNAVFETGKASYYALSFDSTNATNQYITIYKNGIKLSVVTPQGDTSLENNLDNKELNNYPLYIASRAGIAGFTKMNLNTLRMYNRELSESEILNNYNIDKLRFELGE